MRFKAKNTNQGLNFIFEKRVFCVTSVFLLCVFARNTFSQCKTYKENLYP